MSSEPGRPDAPDEPAEPDTVGTPEAASSEAIIPYGRRLDAIAQERFGRTDWIELAAAVLLALATVVAAWSAYQATRWGGVQANAFSAAGAKRVEATQATNIYAANVQVDVQTWIAWLEQSAAEYERGTTFFYERFRDEFKPAFDAWVASVPTGETPPGRRSTCPSTSPQRRPRPTRWTRRPMPSPTRLERPIRPETISCSSQWSWRRCSSSPASARS